MELCLSESQTRILDFGLADAVLFYFLIKGASWYSQPPGRYLYPPAFFFQDPFDVLFLKVEKGEV